MRNSECIIHQCRNGKRIRSFIPSGDKKSPRVMTVLATSQTRMCSDAWVLSKILPTLVEGEECFTTVVEPMAIEP